MRERRGEREREREEGSFSMPSHMTMRRNKEKGDEVRPPKVGRVFLNFASHRYPDDAMYQLQYSTHFIFHRDG